MTRRRALLLVFGALIVVFVLGSVATVVNTRSQLIGDIDSDLDSDLDLNIQFYDSFTPDALDEIVISENPLATFIVNPLGAIELQSPAGRVDNPTPLPDLRPSRIIARVGQDFTVDGTDGGPNYRVTVGRLADGRFIALAAPLDDVRDTIDGLIRTSLITLVCMMLVLGAIFWLLLRASLRPYDELVDTAAAIADGDMDRRAVQTTPDPGIERLTEALNTMLDKLQTSLEEREAAENRIKQFAADASHELRTPITTIAGYSEVYLSGAATDVASVDKQMTRINSEANRMGRLVNDLLTLARLDQGRDVDFEPVDIVALVADTVSDSIAIDATHAITLHTQGTPVHVDGDHDALQQVFINIIANTRVHAPGATVDVGLSTTADSVVITVADDGPGVDSDEAACIFDRFFRVDQARSSTTRSSGLGLSIVKAIIAAHHGTITVDTALGHGMTFTVTLPTQARAAR